MFKPLLFLNLLGVFVLNAYPAFTLNKPEMTGCWKTIDEKTGKESSMVCIYLKENGKIFGSIKKVYPPNSPHQVCLECDGKHKNKPILGLEIMYDYTLVNKESGEWEGKIFDPEVNKEYKSKIWLEDGKLNVRGYVGFFYRTQQWIRDKECDVQGKFN